MITLTYGQFVGMGAGYLILGVAITTYLAKTFMKKEEVTKVQFVQEPAKEEKVVVDLFEHIDEVGNNEN